MLHSCCEIADEGEIYDFGVKQWFVILNCVLGNHDAEYGPQKKSVERCCHTINLFVNKASNLTGELRKKKKESDARVPAALVL